MSKTRTLEEMREMVEIEPCTFMMGALDEDEEANDDEKPRHKVTLTRKVLMGKYPVTQAVWENVMGTGSQTIFGAQVLEDQQWVMGEDSQITRVRKLSQDSLEEGYRPFKDSNFPIYVDWLNCILFCNKLSEKESLEKVYTIPDLVVFKWLREECIHISSTPYHQELEEREEENPIMFFLQDKIALLGSQVTQNLNANGYRLPTEAEWECAARGGEYHIYSGSNDFDEVGVVESSESTVGQKKANGFGLYDMSGLILEWVWDIAEVDEKYHLKKYTKNHRKDPTGDCRKADAGQYDRIYRGEPRVSWRNYDGMRVMGFRLCRTIH